jgi:phage-related protein
MTSVSSFLSPTIAGFSGVGSTSKTPTAFDINAGEFGPTVASAIGVAAAATDAASATYSFSDEGLKKLSDLATSAADGVENAVAGVGNTLSKIGHEVEDDVKKAYGVVKNSVSTVVSKVENAASSVEDEMGSVASAIGDAASYVKDEIASAADSAGHFLAAGVSAFA